MSPKKAPLKLRPRAEVGNLVADFSVKSSSGSEVKLSDLSGKKVILYFYPKDDTPGCTIEGNDFNRLLPEFKAANAVVYGISRDTVASHCKFIDKFGFKFELLSDDEEILCKLFDVIKEKNMYGKIVMGIERSTFILDENQKLIAEFRKIKADGHAQEMLDYIKSL
jgi:peroxiredoxin Q/BCP